MANADPATSSSDKPQRAPRRYGAYLKDQTNIIVSPPETLVTPVKTKAQREYENQEVHEMTRQVSPPSSPVSPTSFANAQTSLEAQGYGTLFSIKYSILKEKREHLQQKLTRIKAELSTIEESLFSLRRVKLQRLLETTTIEPDIGALLHSHLHDESEALSLRRDILATRELLLVMNLENTDSLINKVIHQHAKNAYRRLAQSPSPNLQHDE